MPLRRAISFGWDVKSQSLAFYFEKFGRLPQAKILNNLPSRFFNEKARHRSFWTNLNKIP